MTTPDEHGTSPLDEEARDRSAEERNVVAPTPRSVREKAEGREDPEKPEDESPAR